ncbi:unnamed protein product [Gongylonema pulchrum]|uniref:Uncharacterized protein n=1 Tax=Gongylonema pulchrum TaxID=637853 RepID=A0A183EHW3_9BILA|nr:unnamed protein product [Gongylonema pulchrum]
MQVIAKEKPPLISPGKAASSNQPTIPLRSLPIKSKHRYSCNGKIGLRNPFSSAAYASSSNTLCVALPATMTKKTLKRTAKRMDETGKKARILENAINSVAEHNQHRSIFHSAEQLAQSG